MPTGNAGDIAPDPLAHYFLSNTYSFPSLYFPTNFTTTMPLQCRFVGICNGIVVGSHVSSMEGSVVDLTEIPCQLDGSLCSAIVVRSYVRPIEGLVRDRIEIPCHLDRGISNGIASRSHDWDRGMGGIGCLFGWWFGLGSAAIPCRLGGGRLMGSAARCNSGSWIRLLYTDTRCPASAASAVHDICPFRCSERGRRLVTLTSTMEWSRRSGRG